MNRTPILFLNVLVIAACGLVYELLAGKPHTRPGTGGAASSLPSQHGTTQ